MFSPLSKLSFGVLFLVSVMLAAFGFMKAQVLKAERARDVYWRLEIAKVSLQAELEQQQQREAAQRAELQAQRVISTLRQRLTKMEEVNAVLPTTGCGIELERVRLLNTQAKE
ncbi:hypothetical protein [Bartonella sp. ML70XJBT.G]|uniref:hypothetical protein n=1 Tax=Bartonella sp. ML70XJBT.G TaxID=3019093 RepID=UPI0023613702|nr:hypothetical protein [Bartonella sp. ML70XJBT.G]